MTHHLKTKPEYFQAVVEGKKPFEIRYNDRNFQKGDRVILEEYKGYKKFGTCPDIDSCRLYAYIYDEEEAVEHCPFKRESCRDYGKDIYTGQRCLIQIKDIFNLDNAGKDLIGYIAFTFDILAINGNEPPIEKESVENLKFVCKVFERALNNSLGIDHAYTDAYEKAEKEILKEQENA